MAGQTKKNKNKSKKNRNRRTQQANRSKKPAQASRTAKTSQANKTAKAAQANKTTKPAQPDDLLARLRSVDPAADLPPVAPERVSRLLADVMKQPGDDLTQADATKTASTAAGSTHGSADDKTANDKMAGERPDSTAGAAADVASPAPSGPGRSRWSRTLPWLAGAAAAAMLAIAGSSLMAQRVEAPTQPPAAAPEVTTTTVSAPTGPPARCLAPNPETLARADLAVDATVTDVSGDQVTLTVNQWFAGTPTDELVVTAVPAALRQIIEAPDLQPGQRYLLAANGGRLVVCGFSGPFDSERSTLYTTAFGG